ncbi:hypothetical protein QQS21_008626 [Conoideocrella luteorostrata]|uniref:Uncharacterized protein n=1 Tax=Conoideocrella luteorostrata TaxID=1105319 RepID=A0AAJ0FWE6_9HYPO|nr:hypothetical protein QQS21_008626 [Conoideocrella luteorostrata]
MALNQLLDIQDVLVTAANPARADGDLDVERCARLHNYLVALTWMERHQKSAQELNELMGSNQWSYFTVFGDEADQVRERLDPQLSALLESILVLEGEERPELFLWVQGVAAPSEIQNDGILEAFNVEYERTDDDVPLIALLYPMVMNIAPHSLGVVYHQQLRRVAFVQTMWEAELVMPPDEHDDVWVPLESLLSHWINLVRRGKVSLGEPRWEAESVQGVWRIEAFGDAQVASTVAAFDRLATAIEQRMDLCALLPVDGDKHLLSDADLDAAGAPASCFARSFLTQVRTPRFKHLAPGIEVPHDASAFAARQAFTQLQLQRDDEDDDRPIVPPILMFASCDSRTVSFDGADEYENRNPFPQELHVAPVDHSAPAGLYSEAVKLGSLDMAGESFRLLLPFALVGGDGGARLSDGSPVNEGSISDLFQHGRFPLGGLQMAQRLERLFDAWIALVERGVWRVGPTGVEGSMDVFRDADTAWHDYWIPLDLEI